MVLAGGTDQRPRQGCEIIGGETNPRPSDNDDDDGDDGPFGGYAHARFGSRGGCRCKHAWWWWRRAYHCRNADWLRHTRDRWHYRSGWRSCWNWRIQQRR